MNAKTLSELSEHHRVATQGHPISLRATASSERRFPIRARHSFAG